MLLIKAQGVVATRVANIGFNMGIVKPPQVKSDVIELARIQKGLVEGVESLLARQMGRLRQEIVMMVEERIKVWLYITSWP